MSTEIARVEFTPDQVALIKRTICVGATDDELSLFLQQCRRTALDPFARQIYGIKRKGKLTIQVGIDGFRLNAVRTGLYDGQDGPYWCGPDGVWRDSWLAKGPPAAAKVIVFRSGVARGFVGVARFDEYAQYYDGALSDQWGRMGANMIAKCAEALALRKAFPQELSGLYAPEETDQDDDEAPASKGNVKQLPAPKGDPHAHARARLRGAETLAQLGEIWGNLSPDAQRALLADKDARKAELATTSQKHPEPKTESPATAAIAEGEQRSDPPKGATAPTTAPTAPSAASPTSGAPAAIGPEAAGDTPAKAGANIVRVLLALMHKLGLAWPEIRDAVGDGAAIAQAAGLAGLPLTFRIVDLTSPEALRLKTELEARVTEKERRAKQRAESAARKRVEQVGPAS